MATLDSDDGNKIAIMDKWQQSGRLVCMNNNGVSKRGFGMFSV